MDLQSGILSFDEELLLLTTYNIQLITSLVPTSPNKKPLC